LTTNPSVDEQQNTMASETYHPAFTNPPADVIAGIPVKHFNLPVPNISYDLPYYEACSKHIKDTYHASRIYIVASRSLCANTDKLDLLIQAIGKDQVVGVKKGITPHTPWSEILQITKECREARVDCVVTLGAGSVTDGCKLVVLVLTLLTLYQEDDRLMSGRRSRTASAHPISLLDTQSKAKTSLNTL